MVQDSPAKKIDQWQVLHLAVVEILKIMESYFINKWLTVSDISKYVNR